MSPPAVKSYHGLLRPARIGILVGLVFVFLTVADAAETAPVAVFLDEMDEWYERIGRAVTAPIERVDRFFSDERLEEEPRKSRLHVIGGIRYEEGDGLSLATDLRYRVALPRTEKRLQFFLDQAFEFEDPENRDQLRETVRKPNPDAGLQFLIPFRKRVSSSVGVGFRFRDPFQMYGRLRLHYRQTFESWEMLVSQQVVWYTSDGWAEASELRWDRPLPSGFLFRSASRLEWKEQEKGVEPSQRFSLFKEWNSRTASELGLTGRWPNVPHTHEASYGLSLSVRRQIHRDWLFLQGTPEIELPQSDGYNPTIRLTVQMEAIFGDP